MTYPRSANEYAAAESAALSRHWSANAVYGGFGAALTAGGLTAMFVSLAAGVGVGDGVRWFLYAIAAAVVAIILGVIFGVPRERTGFVPGSGERYTSNSNLEQISDWLTKLLVGAGLVELTNLPDAADSLGAYLGDGMKIPNAAAFSLAAVSFGGGVGFVFGYLWTRLRMRLYLEASDRLAAEQSKARGIVENLRRQNAAHAETEAGRDLDRAAQSAVEARKAIGRGSIAPILWVDDTPQNNSALIAAMRSLDIEVTLARSTGEALELFDARSFGLIITDLGRAEGGTYNPSAGVDLIRAVRAKDAMVPIFVFGTHRAVGMQEDLLREGANLVTTRASVLLEEATRAVTTPRTKPLTVTAPAPK
ncbi:response regulator [Kribbella sp. NBC_01484]|uniref:response regulator n=1 Tax=Kribbella sp. NBC_01484 TaxID=2903579 RepID=UPI002E2EC9A2|nr:response regulator [Kribbella sp. NBC_01484]